MNNDNKQGASPDVAPQYMYHQQNAINLVHVWHLLFKQKKIMFFTVLAFTALGLFWAASKTKTYAFSTTIQIGTVNNDGKTVLIESADTALNKIIAAYIPFVLAQHYGKTPSDKARYSLEVSVPKKSDVLIVEAKGAIDQEPAYKELINRVVQKLVDDHARITNLKIKNYEVSIAHAENMLSSSKDNAKLIASNIERIEKTADLLRTQLAEKKQLLTSALKNRSHVNSNNATGAMSVLLIDSEIQRYQQMIDQLEKQLLIDLNQQRNENEKALSDNLREQNDQQNTIDKLKNELTNIDNTKAIVPVMTSTDPVGLGKAAIILIFVLLGGVLGIVAALLYEFFQTGELGKKTSTAD